MDLHESKRETAFQIADAAFKEYDPSSIAKTIGVLDKLTKEIDWGDLSYFDAEYVFFVFKQKLAGLLEAEDCPYRANIETAIESMESEAKVYFENRIVFDTKGDHVADILVKMEELLDDECISTYLRDALTSVKEGCEKKIERQRKRAKIREELKMFDEPAQSLNAEANGSVIVANDEYDPANRGLTRQLAMMLLDDLFPNLKDASNKSKAEFLALLTGWNSDGLRNKWSDYRLGNKESIKADSEKVEVWKRRLKISDN